MSPEELSAALTEDPAEPEWVLERIQQTFETRKD